MFEYTKIKADLEQVKCPVHQQTATVEFANGTLVFKNVCCKEHRNRLEQALPDIEEQNLTDILEEFIFE